MSVEDRIKELIELKSGSVRAFAVENDIPYTTLRSILERGVLNAKAETVFAICKILNIKPESLVEGIVARDIVNGNDNNITNVNGDQKNGGAYVYGNNTGINTTGDIHGNVSFGSTIQKEDLHEVANNLNLTDRELQEKTLREVSELKASQARLENAIAKIFENQANVLANMKSVDDSFKEILADVKEVGEVFKGILREFKK